MRFLTLSLLLGGCAVLAPATDPVQLTAKDGRAALFLECKRTLINCHQAAAKACPAGYVPLEDNRRTFVDSDALGVYSTHRFELTFRCK